MKKRLVVFGLIALFFVQFICSLAPAHTTNLARIERSTFENLQGQGRFILAEFPFLINELGVWIAYYEKKSNMIDNRCMPYELGMALLRFEAYFTSSPQAVFRAILATRFESEIEYQKAEKWLNSIRVATWLILQEESNVVVCAIDHDSDAFAEFLTRKKFMPSCNPGMFLIMYKDYLRREIAI